MSVQSIGQVNNYKQNPSFGSFTTSIKKPSAEVQQVLTGLEGIFKGSKIADADAYISGSKLNVSVGAGEELLSRAGRGETYKTEILEAPLDNLTNWGKVIVARAQKAKAGLEQRNFWNNGTH